MDPIKKFLDRISYKFPKGYPDMNDDQDILLLETLVNSFLKTTEGFTKLGPTLFCIANMTVCIFCLSKAMSVIPVGFTYATYGALTITAVTLFGIFKYQQTPNIYGILGIGFIVVGVILLNTLGKLKS